MCLAQGHKAVTPVRLEPAASWSRVKHSTTEPLRSLLFPVNEMDLKFSKTVIFYNRYEILEIQKCYSMALMSTFEIP